MAELVIAGYGMVAHRLVEAMSGYGGTSRTKSGGGWHITVLAEEPRPAYDRVALTSYFTGATEDDLRLPAQPGADIHLGDPVTCVDRAARTVTTASGATYPYDALVLATGSIPFVPPVTGADANGCFVYRTLDDLDAIRTAAKNATTGVVIGGGLLGLEAAGALRALGLDTHVVEFAPHLMPTQTDPGAGALLGNLITDLGVTLHTGTAASTIHTDAYAQAARHTPAASAIQTGPNDQATGSTSGTGPAGSDDRAGRVTALTLGDGTRLDTDLVVFSAGVRPRDRLARDAGLALGPRGGVAVDGTCRTEDPYVWAIGECASLDGSLYGLVAPGYAMAEVVADQLTGGDSVFPGADTATKLKLLGVDVASFGDAHARTPGALEVVLNDPVARTYAKLVVSDDAATLLGGVLVGDASAYATLRPLVGGPLPAEPAALISPSAADPGTGVAALPADAQICSCNAVTKGTILGAIDDGADGVPAIKACTKAGTTCGSCVPTLKLLLDDAGVATSKALCEHFAQTRAELFQIVAATGIRTFSELVATHGTGRGCDICKPAVASILATLHNEHVLDGDRAALQDTNDHFLANMQRNGTYSVVPRVPGGEITPARLKVIAEVAEDFGLYTKITGGQRIDLFGARVEQLPHIWRRLVDAGFESGHAYGKAVRTVKSCVGDTWCRYGVQDSVGLAVELELRYRGLRAPHKIKAGVSGCARECAEARAKDVGVIATEHGWNLYVGGNGGFSPRHAQLLAGDVDHDTLVRYIDRFLMFYVRTADRLQRTAAWIESLDGGLDHVRAVIADDALGIAADLDAAMDKHVATYADEWRAVLEDPAKLSRFVSFANAPGTPDPSIAFTVERDQPVPAGPVDLGIPAIERSTP